MRLLLLLICGSWLLPLALLGQTVAGRVVDAQTGKGIAGATVLQFNTRNGTTAGPNGYFTLPVASAADSVRLVVSTVTYVSQELRVAPGSTTVIRLMRGMICYSEPRAAFALCSGLRYAPYGASIKLNGSDFIRIPLAATSSYQTNFSRNHAFTAGLILQAAWLHRFITSQALAYEQLQARPANARFTSYRATVSIGNFYRVALLRQINLLVGGGYARYQALLAPEASASAGFGYSVGLDKAPYTSPLKLSGTVQATRWPGYWQYQARLAYPLSHGFQAGVAFNQLRQYRELTALLGYEL